LADGTLVQTGGNLADNSAHVVPSFRSSPWVFVVFVFFPSSLRLFVRLFLFK
jgi:hypothetical protein